MGIAEDLQLEMALTAASRIKPKPPAQPINPRPVGYIQGDPNDSVETVPRRTPVRDRLRSAVADPNTTEQDRAAAKETLRISLREF